MMGVIHLVTSAGSTMYYAMMELGWPTSVTLGYILCIYRDICDPRPLFSACETILVCGIISWDSGL